MNVAIQGRGCLAAALEKVIDGGAGESLDCLLLLNELLVP